MSNTATDLCLCLQLFNEWALLGGQYDRVVGTPDSKSLFCSVDIRVVCAHIGCSNTTRAGGGAMWLCRACKYHRYCSKACQKKHERAGFHRCECPLVTVNSFSHPHRVTKWVLTARSVNANLAGEKYTRALDQVDHLRRLNDQNPFKLGPLQQQHNLGVILTMTPRLFCGEVFNLAHTMFDWATYGNTEFNSPITATQWQNPPELSFIQTIKILDAKQCLEAATATFRDLNKPKLVEEVDAYGLQIKNFELFVKILVVFVNEVGLPPGNGRLAFGTAVNHLLETLFAEDIV